MKTREPRGILIGKGCLCWLEQKQERDRYGCLHMREEKATENIKKDWRTYFHNIQKYAGKRGKLVCEMLETSNAALIGNPFVKAKQRMPVAGDFVSIGEGWLHYQFQKIAETDCLTVSLIGPQPSDWLDPRAVYKVLNQFVHLYFEPATKRMD